MLSYKDDAFYKARRELQELLDKKDELPIKEVASVDIESKTNAPDVTLVAKSFEGAGLSEEALLLVAVASQDSMSAAKMLVKHLKRAGIIPKFDIKYDAYEAYANPKYVREYVDKMDEYHSKVEEKISSLIPRDKRGSFDACTTYPVVERKQRDAWKENMGKVLSPIRRKAVQTIRRKATVGLASRRTAEALNYLLCVDEEVFKDYYKLLKSNLLNEFYKTTKFTSELTAPELRNKLIRAVKSYVTTGDGVGCFNPKQDILRIVEDKALNKYAYNLLVDVLYASKIGYINDLRTLRKEFYQKYIRQDQVNAEIYNSRLTMTDLEVSGQLSAFSRYLADKLNPVSSTLEEELSVDEFTKYLSVMFDHVIHYLMDYYKAGRLSIINDAITKNKAPKDMIIVSDVIAYENEAYSLEERNKVICQFFEELIVHEWGYGKAGLSDYSNRRGYFKYNVEHMINSLIQYKRLSTRSTIHYDKVIFNGTENTQPTKSAKHLQSEIFEIKNIDSLIQMIKSLI